MIKRLTCIECPAGCSIDVLMENGEIKIIQGNKCVKGEEYARTEVEDPRRLLTTTVKASGLPVRMVPVRTDRGVPRKKIFDAMKEISKLCIKEPVRSGDVIADDLLGMGIKLISTRTIGP